MKTNVFVLGDFGNIKWDLNTINEHIHDVYMLDSKRQYFGAAVAVRQLLQLLGQPSSQNISFRFMQVYETVWDSSDQKRCQITMYIIHITLHIKTPQ